MMAVGVYVLFFACVLLLPPCVIGVIRKGKALMQGRVGAPLSQPFFDLFKLLGKDQTVSQTTTWIFRSSCAMNLATTLIIAGIVPWLSFKPIFPGDDLFLLLYLLALCRFMTILSALDSGSPFGAFAASREAFLSMLVEPAMFISLGALALIAHSTSLHVVFDLSLPCSTYDVPVWLAAAAALFLGSIVDLSRMPIDDPTTHLELTMVHEAMIIENSGKNLALVEFTHFLRMAVVYGLISQCMMHAVGRLVEFNQLTAAIVSVVSILGMAVLTVWIESVFVKLRWRSTPEFIAYAMTMSFFATGGALIGDMYARHGL